MKVSDFVDVLTRIATDYKTVYAWGMFGSRITRANVLSKAKQYPAWYTETKINTVFAPRYETHYGFDCVGLVKAVLWGWDNGGAVYLSNGVPDLSADGMIAKCSEVSSDFTSLSVGEFVWMKGHCGVYVGNGKVVESTPKWKNGVQITDLSARKWLKHGKLPYVEYGSCEPSEEAKIVTIELPMLSVGSEGNVVKTLQRLLRALGKRDKYGRQLAIDGEFGANTEYALRAYQKAKGLTVDGICGEKSWSKLLGLN